MLKGNSFQLSLSLTQKGLLIMAAVLIAEMSFVAVLIGLLHEADNQLRREQHAQAIIYHLNRQANLMQNLTIMLLYFYPVESLIPTH